MEINSETCDKYFQVRRMAYVPNNLHYCRFVCNGTKESCLNNDYKSIGSAQRPFRQGNLALIVLGDKR